MPHHDDESDDAGSADELDADDAPFVLNPAAPTPRAQGDSYRVIYEDGALLAVNKRAGAFCRPVGRLHNRSLVNDLRADRGEEGAELRPCHRLDRFVSGLLLFAKTREAAGSLGVQ